MLEANYKVRFGLMSKYRVAFDDQLFGQAIIAVIALCSAGRVRTIWMTAYSIPDSGLGGGTPPSS